jgi:hypothetical protein
MVLPATPPLIAESLNRPLAQLETISPSRFSGMRECTLREVWSSDRDEAPLPVSPKSFLGSAVHQLVEDALNGRLEDPSDIGDRFDELVQLTEAKLARSAVNIRWLPLARSIPEYERFRERAVTAAEASFVARRRAGDAPEATGPAVRPTRRAGPEVMVQSRGGRVRGRIDEVELTAAGPLLRDLKTGALHEFVGEARQLKRAYVEQMHLYAAIFAEDIAVSGGIWPHRLELVALTGEVEEVEFEQTRCTSLLDEAVAALEHTNDVISTEQAAAARRALASPSPDICRWCAYRPACDPYRLAVEAEPDGDWPLDRWGTVIDVKSLGNGTVSLTLETHDGPARVRGLSADRLPSVTEGQKVAVYGARRQGGTRTIAEGQYTLVIASED